MTVNLSPTIESYLSVIQDAVQRTHTWGFEHNLQSVMDTLRECHDTLDMLYSLDFPNDEAEKDFYWEAMIPQLNSIVEMYLYHIDHLHIKILELQD